jgi:SAM-dependent methyltransferase
VHNEIRVDEVEMPGELPEGIPTLNKMGYMTRSLDYYSRRFVSYSSVCKGQVLEIGAAYGSASLEALSRGSRVLSNDLSADHLKILERKCPAEDKERLTTIAGNFLEVELPENHFDAILMARVAHFMDGETIRKAFSRCHDLLKKDGKLFIVSDTPYMQDSISFIETFEQKLRDNEEWPGLVEDITPIGSPSLPNLPKLFHFLDAITLRRELELAGLHVEEVSYFSRDDYPASVRLDEREGVGAVVTKKE